MKQEDIFYKALVDKDISYEGRFIVGVKTTGIFCRSICTARKPKKENVEFFENIKEAILAGYRPCKICNPLENIGKTPDYVKNILEELSKNPSLKLKDYDLVEKGIEPNKIRRWFLKNHGITFHTYQRMLRINSAFKKIKRGEYVTDVAYDSGYESLSGFSNSFKNIFGVSPKNNKNQIIIDLTRIDTPLGAMIACATEKGICLLAFSDRKMLETSFKKLTKNLNAHIIQGDNKYFKSLNEELGMYYLGKLKEFTVPLHIIGTDFQKQVWGQLQKIPYGTTISYQQLANDINNSKAVRAVANANGMNTISIIVPCHRVIGADGGLTGYAGGVFRKEQLLNIEKKHK